MDLANLPSFQSRAIISRSLSLLLSSLRSLRAQTATAQGSPRLPRAAGVGTPPEAPRAPEPPPGHFSRRNNKQRSRTGGPSAPRFEAHCLLSPSMHQACQNHSLPHAPAQFQRQQSRRRRQLKKHPPGYRQSPPHLLVECPKRIIRIQRMGAEMRCSVSGLSRQRQRTIRHVDFTPDEQTQSTGATFVLLCSTQQETIVLCGRALWLLCH